MKVDTHKNVLVSYAYLYKNEALMSLLDKHYKQGELNIMLDSGAFTAFNSNSGAYKHINVEQYTEWLKTYSYLCEKYVMLDVIQNKEQSRDNYKYMVKEGLKPMFVVTAFEDDWAFVRETLNVTRDLCVAGGAETIKTNWNIYRYQKARKETDGKARIHALGYNTFPKMLQLRLTSVDSSSPITAASRFGQFVLFDDKKIRTIRRSPYSIIKHPEAISNQIKRSFEEHGIKPSMLHDKNYLFKDKNLQNFMNLLNVISLQKYCKKCGLDFFLALGDARKLQFYLALCDNEKMTYKEFLEI